MIILSLLFLRWALELPYVPCQLCLTFTIMSWGADSAVVLMWVANSGAKCSCRTRDWDWCSTGAKKSSRAQSCIRSASSPVAIKPCPAIAWRGKTNRVKTLKSALVLNRRPTCSLALLTETTGRTWGSCPVVSGVWSCCARQTKKPCCAWARWRN